MILSQNSPEVKRIPLRYASDYRSYSIEEADRMRVIVDYPPEPEIGSPSRIRASG